MYEVAIEPLGKNYKTYAPWPDIRYFSGLVNTTLPLFILHKFQTPPGCQSVPRVFYEHVCEVFTSFGMFVRRKSCSFVSRSFVSESLAFNYIVMLLILCLVVIASLVMLGNSFGLAFC
jgi:hypothetical protein